MRILKWAFALVLLFVVVLIVLLVHLDKQVHQNLNISQPVLYEVKTGQSAKGVLNRLKQQDVLSDNLGLKIRLKFDPALAQIKVGTYELLPSMSALQMLQMLASGKEKQFSISLVEGLNWREWLVNIKQHPHINMSPDFEQQISQLSKNLPYKSLEGYLLPDTYYFVANTSAIELVKRAHQQMQNYLLNSWHNRAVDLPYDTAYQGLIMASIIEKETGIAEERPRIAGVFVNRLRRNMRLQTDPTVIYGIGPSFDGDIRRKDLRTPTPYNTYVIKGLPPTPIAMPSKLAIDAAFNPVATNELYFVSKGDGSHKFSASLKEHNQAVRQYQLKKK